ncbi:hypothetical protein V1478_001050, partial [Vespula squamosa]
MSFSSHYDMCNDCINVCILFNATQLNRSPLFFNESEQISINESKQKTILIMKNKYIRVLSMEE